MDQTKIKEKIAALRREIAELEALLPPRPEHRNSVGYSFYDMNAILFSFGQSSAAISLKEVKKPRFTILENGDEE